MKKIFYFVFCVVAMSIAASCAEKAATTATDSTDADTVVVEDTLTHDTIIIE